LTGTPSRAKSRSESPERGGPSFGWREGALYLAIVLLWGTSWIALHLQLGVVAPEVSVLWRFVLADAIMFAIALTRRERLAFPIGDHIVFALMGCGLFSSNFLLFYYSGLHIPSGLLGVMFSLASVGNLLIATVVTRKPPRARLAIGGIMGTAGVALMYLPQMSQGAGGAGLGLLLGALGTLCFCLGNLAAVSARRRGASLVSSSAWGMLYGGAALLALCLARGASFAIEPTHAYLLALAWLAGPCTVGAFLVYLALVDRIGAPRASYATVLFPVVSLTISTFAEGYVWTLPAIIGIAVVLVGNVFVLARSRPG
jgi:drug/metabolite transporter (DMT)-like permease